MTDAIKDQNRIPVMMGVSYVDGVTLVPITVHSTNGGLSVDKINTFAGTIDVNAIRDNNHNPVLMGVNSVDGTLIPVYVNPTNGAILTD